MNYKEQVAQQIHETLVQLEQSLTKQVTDWVVESFKNGVDAGKQRSRQNSKGRTPADADEPVTD